MANGTNGNDLIFWDHDWNDPLELRTIRESIESTTSLPYCNGKMKFNKDATIQQGTISEETTEASQEKEATGEKA